MSFCLPSSELTKTDRQKVRKTDGQRHRTDKHTRLQQTDKMPGFTKSQLIESTITPEDTFETFFTRFIDQHWEASKRTLMTNYEQMSCAAACKDFKLSVHRALTQWKKDQCMAMVYVPVNITDYTQETEEKLEDFMNRVVREVKLADLCRKKGVAPIVVGQRDTYLVNTDDREDVIRVDTMYVLLVSEKHMKNLGFARGAAPPATPAKSNAPSLD